MHQSAKLLFGCCAFLGTAAVSPAPQMAPSVIQAVDQTMMAQAYHFGDWEKVATVPVGSQRSFPLELSPTKDGALVAFCNACLGEVSLVDSKGVSASEKINGMYALLYIEVKKRAKYRLLVTITSCTDLPCSVGLKLFKK